MNTSKLLNYRGTTHIENLKFLFRNENRLKSENFKFLRCFASSLTDGTSGHQNKLDEKFISKNVPKYSQIQKRHFSLSEEKTDSQEEVRIVVHNPITE
jgi:hypothetical protein